MVQDSKPSRNLVSIQVLRAVAALFVVFFHASGNVSKYGWALAVSPHIAQFGEAGVDIFFVISGFVMVIATVDTAPSSMAGRRFMLARLGRIVPLYWVLTTAFVAILLLAPHVFGAATFNAPHVLASYAFLPWRNPLGLAAPVLNVGWTLNYEIWFYLVFGALLCFTRHRVLGAAAFFAVSASLHWLWAASLAFQFYTDPITLEFVFGAVIGAFYMRGAALRQGAGYALVLLAGAVVVAFRPDMTDANRFVLFGMPAAMLVTAAVTLEARAHWPAALKRIGDSSYSLYLTHVFTVPIVAKLAQVVDPRHRMPGDFVCLMMVAASVAVAHFTYRAIEQPLGRSLRARHARYRTART